VLSSDQYSSPSTTVIPAVGNRELGEISRSWGLGELSRYNQEPQ